MVEKALDVHDLEEAQDIVYSIRNLCLIFDLVAELPTAKCLFLLPTLMEEIFVKSQTLVDMCIDGVKDGVPLTK